MVNSSLLMTSFRKISSQNITSHICIVGAGPAGFYTAQQLLKNVENIKIDILERLPVPYGLVRFGVAPDHPEVKNVINTFNKIAKDARVKFLGNIDVGKDVSVEKLKELYHAVLLTYGAEEDKTFNIPGENLKNIISAKKFVGWYNGVPNDKNLEIDLSAEDAVILGQGNVAIDTARILLSPIDKLKNTDITSYSLEQLAQSKVKRVWLVGRRGPLQTAFTIAELREMLKLENCKTNWRITDFEGIKEIVDNLARPRKRLTELMLKSVQEAPLKTKKYDKEFHPIFLRGPVEFKGNNFVEKVKLSVNKLEGTDLTKQIAITTSEFEEISCGLVIRSIGYKSSQIDPSIPFDFDRGKVKNLSGKVDNGLYAAGWAATGPVGVILSTMTNAFQVGRLISQEIANNIQRPGYYELEKILKKKNVFPVTFEEWEKIDREECKRGEKFNKPREKIVDISEMLKIAHS